MNDLAVCTLVTRLTEWLPRLMPDRDRADALCAALAARFAGRDDPVTADLCAEIERVAWIYSRHLQLTFEPDGTCVIRVDGLDPAAAALSYVDAAFALARSASRVVLDLRANGGGDPATAAAIAGWLLGDEPVHLSDVHYRDRVRQWWTPHRPTGTAVPAEVPAFVLVGPATFSSGEALAYHLRVRGRVTVVGERTPGGADHVTPIRLAPTVLGILPEARVVDVRTGTNWERVGVRPDIGCSAEDALTRI